MADAISSERLQPCLLDRLTDDEPTKKEESRLLRQISNQKYRRGVLRDLEWLFNTTSYLRAEGYESFSLADYPEAARSVLNYGTRQLCGMVTPEMQTLQHELQEALRIFEPRIAPGSLNIKADEVRNMVVIEIQGELWANPLPEQLHLKTTVDLETGQCLLGDTPHG